MPRPLRIEYAGAIFQVMTRGAHRKSSFLDEQAHQRDETDTQRAERLVSVLDVDGLVPSDWANVLDRGIGKAQDFSQINSGSVRWDTAINGTVMTAGSILHGFADLLRFGDAVGTAAGNPCADGWDWAIAGAQDTARGAGLFGLAGSASFSVAGKLGAAKGLPKTRDALHIDLRNKGFEYKSTSPNGYVTYKGPDGRTVTTKPSGEVIPTQRVPKNHSVNCNSAGGSD